MVGKSGMGRGEVCCGGGGGRISTLEVIASGSGGIVGEKGGSNRRI